MDKANARKQAQRPGMPFQDPHGHGGAQGKLLEQAIGRAVKEFRAREVIVTCGAIFSPALLLRSGIGDAGEGRLGAGPGLAAVRGMDDDPELVPSPADPRPVY